MPRARRRLRSASRCEGSEGGRRPPPARRRYIWATNVGDVGRGRDVSDETALRAHKRWGRRPGAGRQRRNCAPGAQTLGTSDGGASAGDLLHHVGVDVEVGVDLVDVVVVVERLHQAHQASSRRPPRPRPWSSAPSSRRRSRSRSRPPRAPRARRSGRSGAVSTRRSSSGDHVLGAGVDRDDQVVLAVAVGVEHDHAALLEHPGDRVRLAEASRRCGRRRGGSRSRCGCGCRSAPRRGSRRRRARSPRRRSARSRRRRRPRRCRGRSPAGCCPSASTLRAPCRSRAPGTGCPRGLPRPHARRR